MLSTYIVTPTSTGGPASQQPSHNTNPLPQAAKRASQGAGVRKGSVCSGTYDNAINLGSVYHFDFRKGADTQHVHGDSHFHRGTWNHHHVTSGALAHPCLPAGGRPTESAAAATGRPPAPGQRQNGGLERCCASLGNPPRASIWPHPANAARANADRPAILYTSTYILSHTLPPGERRRRSP